MIVQNVGDEGRAESRSPCHATSWTSPAKRCEDAHDSLGAFTISHDDQVAKVSVVGKGMADRPGVAERMFRALSDADINIQMITTSEIKISTLIPREQALLGLRTVHHEFQLEREPDPAELGSRVRGAHDHRFVETRWMSWSNCAAWRS